MYFWFKPLDYGNLSRNSSGHFFVEGTMALVRLSWMNESDPTETRLIDQKEFPNNGDDVGGQVMAWAQEKIVEAVRCRPDGRWSPLLEEIEPPVPWEPPAKPKRRLAV